MKVILSGTECTQYGLHKFNNHFHIYFRGYIIWNNRLYYGDEFLEHLKTHFLEGAIFKNLPDYNGAFNIVILNDKHLYIFNDRWGVFPLYYTLTENRFAISNEWQAILPETNRRMRKDAAIEMLTFGYVMGDKTLVEGIYEPAPHSWYKIYHRDSKIELEEHSYWHFAYTFSNHQKEKVLQRQFAELWHERIKIYTDYVKSHGNLAYIPLSGGLDSRLLAAYFDREATDIFAMTFGSSPFSPEIKTARRVVNKLSHVLGHNILYFDQALLRMIQNNEIGNYDPITCAHYERKVLFLNNSLKYFNNYFIPGHDANFMAGENIKLKMWKWKSKDDIINYIFDFKSSKLTRFLLNQNKDYFELLYFNLEKNIPEGMDLITAYNRWNGEQRQRRYIIRSSIDILTDKQNILLPFFDYEIMDFFLELPVKFLLNQRLYINTQINHLFKHNPALIKIKKDGKKKPHRIKNNFWTEYYPKTINRLKMRLNLTRSPLRHWQETINWNPLKENLSLPDWIDLKWTTNEQFSLNLFYLNSISEVQKILSV